MLPPPTGPGAAATKNAGGPHRKKWRDHGKRHSSTGVRTGRRVCCVRGPKEVPLFLPESQKEIHQETISAAVYCFKIISRLSLLCKFGIISRSFPCSRTGDGLHYEQCRYGYYAGRKRLNGPFPIPVFRVGCIGRRNMVSCVRTATDSAPPTVP